VIVKLHGSHVADADDRALADQYERLGCEPRMQRPELMRDSSPPTSA
jgi:hypothetical protein